MALPIVLKPLLDKGLDLLLLGVATEDLFGPVLFLKRSACLIVQLPDLLVENFTGELRLAVRFIALLALGIDHLLEVLQIQDALVLHVLPVLWVDLLTSGLPSLSHISSYQRLFT